MGGAQRDNELHFLPLPLGEVAERSEDGEGKWVRKALSVTFGDSSPRGRAKGLDMLAQEMEHIDTDTLHPLFLRPPIQSSGAYVISAFSPGMPPDR